MASTSREVDADKSGPGLRSDQQVVSPIQQLLGPVGRSATAMAGLVLIIVLVASALLAPVVAPYDPFDQNLRAKLQPPSTQHLLGTDHLGRDVFSRLLYGARLSILLGVGAVAIGAASGISVGLLVGFKGGWLDDIVMRFVDVLLAFRLLLLAIVVLAILGPSFFNVMLAIGASLFAAFTRLTRGEVLSAKTREYVEAARAAGSGSGRIMVRHILPNITAPLIVFATLTLGSSILSESALSFLGLGSAPPTPSWGLMIKEGLNQLRSAWWTSTIPGLAITAVVLAFNLLGDGLRDALDPRMRRIRR